MQKPEFGSLFLALVLICCGVLSHSNGVDDATDISLNTLLGRVTLVVVTFIGGYLALTRVQKRKHYR